MEAAYLIFVIFAPHIQFWAQFFSTQMRVNRDKADSRQHVNRKTICVLEKLEMSPHLKLFQNSPHLSWIEIWNFSTFPICYICNKYQVCGDAVFFTSTAVWLGIANMHRQQPRYKHCLLNSRRSLNGRSDAFQQRLKCLDKNRTSRYGLYSLSKRLYVYLTFFLPKKPSSIFIKYLKSPSVRP